MIEHVSFNKGGGFYADGLPWDQLAAPQLEHGWNRLEPGVHCLSLPGELLVYNMVVMSDGRARLTMELGPHAQKPMTRLIFDRFVRPGARYIEEKQPFAELCNVWPEDVLRYRPMGAGSALPWGVCRITGIVRYNPES